MLYGLRFIQHGRIHLHQFWRVFRRVTEFDIWEMGQGSRALWTVNLLCPPPQLERWGNRIPPRLLEAAELWVRRLLHRGSGPLGAGFPFPVGFPGEAARSAAVLPPQALSDQ